MAGAPPGILVAAKRYLYGVSCHNRPNDFFEGICVEVGAKREEVVDTAPADLAFDGRPSPSQVSPGRSPKSPQRRRPYRDLTTPSIATTARASRSSSAKVRLPIISGRLPSRPLSMGDTALAGRKSRVTRTWG